MACVRLESASNSASVKFRSALNSYPLGKSSTEKAEKKIEPKVKFRFDLYFSGYFLLKLIRNYSIIYLLVGVLYIKKE